GSGRDSAESLKQLFTLANQYLGQAVPHQARVSASEIAEIAKSETLDSEREARFRSALASLRQSLVEQRKLESTTSQLGDDPELVQEFLAEAREHLSSVEAGVLSLERDPGNGDALHAVFRSFHTIKGLAGFLGASAIHELAHET